MWKITGKTSYGKDTTVYRQTKAEALKHANAAKMYGGKNIKILKS